MGRIDDRLIRHRGSPHHLYGQDDSRVYWPAKVAPKPNTLSTRELRVYSGFETFHLLHPSCIPLIEDTLATGRPVFLLLEPWHRTNPQVVRILDRFETGRAIPVEGWPDAPLVEILRLRDSRELSLPGGSPPVRRP